MTPLIPCVTCGELHAPPACGAEPETDPGYDLGPWYRRALEALVLAWESGDVVRFARALDEAKRALGRR